MSNVTIPTWTSLGVSLVSIAIHPIVGGDGYFSELVIWIDDGSGRDEERVLNLLTDVHRQTICEVAHDTAVFVHSLFENADITENVFLINEDGEMPDDPLELSDLMEEYNEMADFDAPEPSGPTLH